MKATTQYIKRLLDQNRRISRDSDAYKSEPQDMPDWAKALREHNNNIRSV